MPDHATHRFRGLPSLSQADPCRGRVHPHEFLNLEWPAHTTGTAVARKQSRSTTSSYPLQQSRSTTAGPLHEVHYRSGSTTANRRQREDVWSSAVSADRAAGGVGCVVAVDVAG